MIEIKYQKLFVLQAIIIGSLGAAFFVFFKKDFSSIFYTIFWMLGIVINTFFIHKFTIPSKTLLKKLKLPHDNDLTWEDINEFLDRKNQDNLKNQLISENEENKYKALLDQLEDPVFLVNNNQEITYVNLACNNLIGSEKPKLPMPLFEFTRNLEFNNFIKNSLTEGKTTYLNYFSFEEIPTPNKNFYDVKFFSSKNELDSLCILHNVTEKKLTELIREDFIANFSHEVRTPLTILNGLLQSLKTNKNLDDENSKTIFYKIDMYTSRLNNLFNALLTLSSIEFKKEILKETINIEDPIRFLVQDLELNYKDKNFKVEFRFSELNFNADYELFLQLISNLVVNSFKYTPPEGKIIITTESSEKYNIITVEDNGIGIPAEHQSRVFERFFRVDQAHSSQIPGNGIGLSIVKHIVSKHNGKIKIESEINKGTAISVYFPKELI